MKLKKMLAGVMAIAMTATMLPGSMFAVPETVEAKTETSSLPEAKYEMDFEGNLDVIGPEGVTASLYGPVRPTIYEGQEQYTDGRNGGSALRVTQANGYGVVFDNIAVGNAYTVSAWIYQDEVQPDWWASTILGIFNTDADWIALCGDRFWAAETGIGGNDELGGQPTNYHVRGQWVNYTLLIDGEEASWYVNGVKTLSSSSYKVPINSELKELVLGVNYWDAIPNISYDEVEIYDEALTDAQIKALYSGTAVELSSSVPSGDIRIGETTEITANIIGGQTGDTIEWSSNSECVSMNDGVITAVSEGTATITANVMRNGDIMATGTIDINVLPEKGSLIAEFTFDEEASEFYGAGAVAKKADPDDTYYASVVNDETKGSVLHLNNTGNAEVGNWLEVTKKDGSSLLSGVKEFTVSYDSSNNGLFQNSWTFFADQLGVRADARQYIAIVERTDDAANSLQVERHNINTGAGATVANAWKHVDVVFGENSTEIYVDGVLRASDSNDYSVEECLGENSFIHIGHATWPVDELTGENLGREYWNGYLDNYKIYDYALTAEEVRTEYRNLDYHPAVDATCTTDGNIEYWTDADGNYYLDAAGEIPTTADEVKVDATGHSYGQPTWEWMKSEDGSTYTAATATFICEKGDDTQQVTDEEVAHVIEDGQVTYSAEVTFGEQSYETTTTAGLVLTATEEFPATCTEAGTKAYWTDQFGNRYLDEEGHSPVTNDEELVIPATGHDYISSGRWTATEDGYSLDVTFTCKHGDDTATVSPEVTSSSDSGVTTYTAVAEYNGKQFTYSYEVQDSYTLTVVDGTIAGPDVTTNNYGYNDVVTVVADAEKDGQYFAGWYIGDTLVSNRTTYTFCIVEDKVLTAKYSAEETEEKAVVSLRMSDREDIGSGAERVVATLEWSVPSDYTMMEAGILRSYTESSAEKLSLEEVDGLNVRQVDSGLWCKNGIYKLTVNMSPSTAQGPLNARGYLVYEDAAGEEYTIYTDVIVSPATE